MAPARCSSFESTGCGRSRISIEKPRAGVGSPRSVRWLLDFRHDGRVVARADLRQNSAVGGLDARAEQDVVDPPALIFLSHLAPRRPPRKEAIVGRVERP